MFRACGLCRCSANAFPAVVPKSFSACVSMIAALVLWIAAINRFRNPTDRSHDSAVASRLPEVALQVKLSAGKLYHLRDHGCVACAIVGIESSTNNAGRHSITIVVSEYRRTNIPRPGIFRGFTVRAAPGQSAIDRQLRPCLLVCPSPSRPRSGSINPLQK